MKQLIILSGLAAGIFSFSCQKKYSCVCESVKSKRDSIMETVMTTKIGSKGFKEDCIKRETRSQDLVNCRLE